MEGINVISMNEGVDIGTIMIGVLLLIVVLYVAGCIRSFRQEKERRQKMMESWDSPTSDEPAEREIRGRIVEKVCRTVTRGTKSPRAEKEFYIDFQTEDGEIMGYKVDEEIYLSVEENQTGTVLMVGERFYGFCPDEEPSDG